MSSPLQDLDQAMRAARAELDKIEEFEPRVVTGWVALWTTVRYDEDGHQVDGWTYAVSESTGAVSAVGALGIAARSIERQVEGP